MVVIVGFLLSMNFGILEIALPGLPLVSIMLLENGGVRAGSNKLSREGSPRVYHGIRKTV